MKIKTQDWLTTLFFALLISGLMLVGCSSEQAISSDPNKDSPTGATTIPTETNPTENETDMNNYKPRLEGKALVEMKVKGSPITIEVNGEEAPITAGNFVDLVERGFYNGLTFHRVVKDPQPFVVQGGDPKGTGTGGFIDPQTKQTRYLPLEIKLKDRDKPAYDRALGRQAGFSAPPVVLKHQRGAVAMARSQMPNSASSQFYFALSDLEFLDGDYAVFGYVTSGMEVIDGIQQGDSIESARGGSGLENLQK